jgi:hypothetical protein
MLICSNARKIFHVLGLKIFLEVHEIKKNILGELEQRLVGSESTCLPVDLFQWARFIIIQLATLV